VVLAKNGILNKIQALAEIPSAGPLPGFTYTHVCCTLLLIGDEETLGRIQMSKLLGLGEGTIRTIIRHLSEAGIIKISRQGCALTMKGTSLYRQLRNRLSKTVEVNGGQLALDRASTAIRVRMGAPRVKRGIEQRDAAVRMGATGACTVFLKGGRFVMPMDTDEWSLNENDPLAIELKNIFNPSEDDVIIIASAREKMLANYAAIAASLTLID
jgi:predicted transcriptional regulator